MADPDRPTNQLAGQSSPYLQEAKHQPVDWHPWGPAAFDKARKQDKPLLVDVGAVWCHWCHVMDHESYEDPETAALINEHFIPVKLDRDERPDLDGRLQRAVGAITGQGGWPLTAFLTPDGDVYYGGTYFPPEPQGRMPSLRQVLESAAHFYNDHPDQAAEQAERIRAALDARTRPDPGEPTNAAVERAVASALDQYDPTHGGFGRQPKFPHPSTVDLLLVRAARGKDPEGRAWQAAVHTLEAMADGGVHDHLAGGFHRYSVDAHWTVPHFEKMLYDNGPLLRNYTWAAALARARGDEAPDDAAGRVARLDATARGTVAFLTDVLQRPGGGFGGSQDADRRPAGHGPKRREELDDGDFFTWTLAELEEVLDGDLLRVAKLHWGVGERGEMHHDPARNVLHVAARPDDIADATGRAVDEVDALIDTARKRLADARAAREAPYVDPTVYTNWNAMAITSLLEHHRLTDDARARDAALAALDRLMADAALGDGRFAHALSPDDGAGRVTGLFDDHAQLVPALIEAFHATTDMAHLDEAARVAAHLMEAFQQDDGTFLESLDGPPVVAPVGDQPTASGVATVALHLPRLSRLTGKPRFEEAAGRALAAHAGELDALGGVFGGTLALAMDAWLDPPAHIVVVGAGREARELRETALRTAGPLTTLLSVDDPDAPGVPPEAREAARAFESGTAAAVVCRGRTCQLGRTVEELAALVGPFAGR